MAAEPGVGAVAAAAAEPRGDGQNCPGFQPEPPGELRMRKRLCAVGGLLVPKPRHDQCHALAGSVKLN